MGKVIPLFETAVTKFHYEGGFVSDQKLHEALDFLISLEPDHNSPTASAAYHQTCLQNQRAINEAHDAVRQFAEQIEPKTLEVMQDVFYSITNSTKYRQSNIHLSVVYSTLNSCWNEVGPWQS